MVYLFSLLSPVVRKHPRICDPVGEKLSTPHAATWTGSGLPRIREGWLAEGRTLDLHDSFEPFDHTVLTLGWPAEVATGKTPEKTLEKTPEAILRRLQQDPGMTIAQLSVALEKSESAIERALRELRDQGRLRRSGPDKGGQWEVLS